MAVAHDITGQRFGQLIALKRGESQGYLSRWQVRCDCGTEKLVYLTHLRGGKTISCGCASKKPTPRNDLTGQQFGDWKVLSADGHIGSKIAWFCQCSCGETQRVVGGALARGRSKSCGCKKAERIGSAKTIDLTGQVFGRLTVLCRNGSNAHNNARWLCQCSCGNQTTVDAGKLKRESKATVSCGCYQQERKENWSPDSITHWINGTFHCPEKENFFYVFTMANYAELSKPGIATDMNDRADCEYGELYDFIAVPRLDAWLIEQAVLCETRSHYECPAELAEWAGHTELRKLEPEILFGYAIGFHNALQRMGREAFAIQYLPTTPKQREQLLAMQQQFVAA